MDEKVQKWRQNFLLRQFWLLTMGLMLMFPFNGFTQHLAAKDDESGGVNQGKDSNSKALTEVLQNLENEYDVKFGFEDKNVAEKYLKMEDLSGQNLDASLKKVLEPFELSFTKIGENFYVIQPEKKEKESVKKLNSLSPQYLLNENRKNDQKSTFAIGGINSISGKGLETINKPIQDFTVSGAVTSQEGEPLPGVNVVVQGTSEGTVTDVNGEYSVQAPEEGTLVFSFVGYENREVPINGRTTIDVSLTQEVSELEEVVVVGYGTQRKQDLTGSITTTDPSDYEELPNTNILQSMHGTVPGLNIGQVDAAGESPDINVRGFNTLSTSASANMPLIVVDGSIFRGNIGDLNPSNIESVDVLKGMSAAAVYGSQASNGVIIITTKKGTEEMSKPTLNFSTKYTHRTPNEHALEPMNAEEYEGFFRDVRWRTLRQAPDYLEPDPNAPPITNWMKAQNVVKGYEQGVDEDWWGPFTSNGHLTNHDLSVRGKTEDIGYFASGGYTGEEGFIKNDQYQRYNFRLNLDWEIIDWMSLALNSSLVQADHSGLEPGGFTFNMVPWARKKDDEGDYVLSPGGTTINPYLTLERNDEDKRLNLMGNANFNIDFPFIQGLSYELTYSNNYRHNRQAYFDPYGASYTGYGSKDHDYTKNWSADNVLNYNRNFGDHRFDFTLLYGVEEVVDQGSSLSARDFPSNLLGYNKLEAGAPERHSLSTYKSKETSLYQMARLNYNYSDKYMLTGTVRRDGFSGFGPDNKIGYFPSVGLGWVTSREPFFNFESIDFFKLRGSYGSTGRRAVNRYQTLPTVSRGPAYVFGDGASPSYGQFINKMANENLSWEKTTGLNVGVDFRFLDSRLRGNIDYYNNNTRDILYNIQLPRMTGFGSIPKNISKVHNYGIDASITGEIFRSNDFNWEATFNFSRNRNEIKELIGQGDLVANELFIGEPQRVIYDYERTGMWQLDDEIPDGFNPGTYKIADLNGDGEYSAADDRKIIGYQDPSYRFSIVNRINYRGFSFHLTINSIQGGEDYYYGNDAPHAAGSWQKGDQLRYNNGPKGGWDYWMPENPDAEYRQLNTFSAYAPGNYSQRNFIRLQDAVFSYTFDQNIIDIVENLKVYISGKNLLTLTDWKGWDPETGVGMTPGGRPVMRNYTIGLNVGF